MRLFMQRNLINKSKPQKNFTQDEIDFILSKIGMYTISSIAESSWSYKKIVLLLF
jgi:hypothetical protein